MASRRQVPPPSRRDGARVSTSSPDEALLAAILHSAPEAIASEDPAGRVTSWNPAAEQLLGYTAAETIGRPMREFLALPPAAAAPDAAPADPATGRMRKLPTLLRRKDGLPIEAAITSAPLREPSGEVVGTLWTFGPVVDADPVLQRRAAELASFMEGSGIGVRWIAPDGTILWANSADMEMLGYREEEFIGRRVAEFHAEPDAATEILVALQRGERLRNHEVRMRRRDGSIQHVALDATVLWEGGRLVRAQCFSRDITPRRTVEAQLRETSQLMAETLDRITDIFMSLDTQWRITYMNRAAAELIGRKRPADQLLGKSFWSEFPELVGTEAEREYRRAMAEQVTTGFELHFPPLEGWFEVKVHPSREGLSIVAREITERKRFEQALRQSDFILNHSGWAVATVDSATNTIEFCNAAFARMHGSTCEELMGGDFLETFAPEWLPQWPEHAAALSRGGDYVYESLHRRADGSVFPVRTHATTFKDDAGRPCFRASVFEDISGRRADEERIRSSVARLQVLADAARTLLQTGDPLQLLQRIFERLASTLQIDVFFHFIVADDGEHLRLRSFHGVSAEDAKRVETLRFGEAVCGVVAREREPRVIANVQDSRTPMTAFVREIGVTAYASEPLIAGGRLLGTLSFGTRRYGAFSPELVETIRAIADLVATATARQQTENALRESEALKTGILNSGLDASVTMDHEGHVVEFNPAAERTFGYARADAIGRVMADLIIPPAYREAHARGMARHLATGETRIIGRRIEITAMRSDGTEFPCELTVARVERAGPPLFTAFIRDITSRRQAEIALRESEERFRTLADNIPQLAWMADASGAVFWVNQQWVNYTGTTLEEVQGWSWRSVHHPEHLERVVAKYQRFVANGEVWEDTFPLRSRDGSFRWFLSRAVPIRDAAGNVVRWFGTNTDITEQREKEQALAEHARLLDLSFDAIIVRDAGEQVAFWNRGAQELYGWTAEEARGKTVHALLQTEMPVPLETIDAQLAAHGRWQGEVVQTRRDGRRITVMTRWALDRDASGRRVGVLETNNDITARREAEQALEAARVQLARRAADLEQAVAERTRDLRATIAELEGFSYSLSHDMRAPLRTIHSFSQIVLTEAGEKLGPLETDLLNRTIRAASRLDRLIQDVLTYSRVSREALSLGTVDVEELLRQIISERPEFQAPKAEIEIVSPLPPVRGHEAYLTQCITNLLDNAVKFVAPGQQPRVRVWSEPAGDQVCLSFQDNGIGIPRAAQERLFGIFQRLHSESEYPGTGIGLAIVRRAVERMGGSVGLESEPGRGSRFWLKLPRGN